ncbi:MAG: cyclic nucleotide-binding domain-containing protein [Bauldia sp.]|nr:cyclic nucleotide-binding domain-containing protein [Bauldia sp.]
MSGFEILLNVTYILYLLAYSVRDILWLRILAVVAGITALPYYYFRPDPIWPPVAWGLVFIAINSFWIAKLLMERRPVKFSDDERRLYQLAFRNMSEHEAAGLFRLGTWTTVPTGSLLLEQGKPVEALSLIASGKTSVEFDGAPVDTVGEGRFLGITAFLSHGEKSIAPVSVRAAEPTRVIVWPSAVLDKQTSRDTQIGIAIEASLGLELSRLLWTSWAELLHPRTNEARADGTG